MLAAVLAGGRSARMGSDKALLDLGGAPLIEGVLAVVRPLFPRVAIIARDPAAYGDLGVPVWPDRIPGKGALGGIYTALWQAAGAPVFCIACDMPFANRHVIAHLRACAPGHDAVVPRSARGYEPLHAVYDVACLPPIEEMLGADRLSIHALFARVRVRTVEPDDLHRLDPSGRCLMNVNTPEELEAARRLVRGEQR
jgi:molybdopterin-guanine dinucleotide biosynthesis protein A